MAEAVARSTVSSLAGHGRFADVAVRTIVDQLEEDIVLGYLHPRERLVEDALMARFDAKRYAVREALARLERMGLVERQPNKGAAVRDLTPAEAEEIYAVRELLEAAAARDVARHATPAFIAELTAAQAQHDAATRDGDPRRAFRANLHFHRVFFSVCGNRQMVEAIEQFGQKAHAVRSFTITRPDYLARFRDEHWRMIRALKRGDAEELVKLCAAHIRIAKDVYVESYNRRFPAAAPPPG